MPELPDWDDLLTSAAHLQSIIPDAVLVGGTASAIHAEHRLSRDHDHVMVDLRGHFSEVLRKLEAVAGWRTERIRPPVLILGSLDGIETGVRQLIRQAPLETECILVRGERLTIPTAAETLRIKAVLILKRNATRDYVDFAALADHMGTRLSVDALRSFDQLYPQESGQSALQQLLAQLSDARPFDLQKVSLLTYKGLAPKWRDWHAVKRVCADQAVAVFDQITSPQREDEPPSP